MVGNLPLVTVHVAAIYNVDNCRLTEIEATFGEVQNTFCLVIKKLHDNTPLHTEALHKMLSLLLHTAEKYKESCSKEASVAAKAERRIEAMFTQVRKSMSDDWIVLYYSQCFGWPTRKLERFTNAEQDVKVYHL